MCVVCCCFVSESGEEKEYQLFLDDGGGREKKGRRGLDLLPLVKQEKSHPPAAHIRIKPITGLVPPRRRPGPRV